MTQWQRDRPTGEEEAFSCLTFSQVWKSDKELSYSDQVLKSDQQATCLGFSWSRSRQVGCARTQVARWCPSIGKLRSSSSSKSCLAYVGLLLHRQTHYNIFLLNILICWQGMQHILLWCYCFPNKDLLDALDWVIRKSCWWVMNDYLRNRWCKMWQMCSEFLYTFPTSLDQSSDLDRHHLTKNWYFTSSDALCSM